MSQLDSPEIISESHKLWLEFLEEWPVDRVSEMQLHEYNKAGDNQTFCAWLEHRLDRLGSIRGGVAFKFGIYSRKEKSHKNSTNTHSWNSDYGWYKKYGDSDQAAFRTVRGLIVEVISAVQSKDLKAIDAIDLSPVFKWKIASIYQDREQCILPTIFNKSNLCAFLEIDNKNRSYSDLYQLIMSSINGRDIIEFSSSVWNTSVVKIRAGAESQVESGIHQNQSTRYWLYAPGQGAGKWEEFKKEGIIAIGWDHLGDLNHFGNKDEIVVALQEYTESSSSKKNDATANYDFRSTMEVGDTVIAKTGTGTLLGYGIVTSDYYHDSSRANYKNCRKVKWIKTGSWTVEFKLVLKTLTDITKYPSDGHHEKYYEFLLDTINNNVSSVRQDVMTAQPKNLILYGPPGTGKTYRLIKEYLHKYVDNTAEITDREWIHRNLEGLRWVDVLALVLVDLGGGPAKVAEIQKHYLLVEYLLTIGGGPKNVKATLWGILQAHTGMECEFVNVSVRRSPSWFVKDSQSAWSLSSDWHESGTEVSDILDRIRNGPDAHDDSSRKRYEFVTFHQSYSYEEFVEGIRPVLSTHDDSDDVRYKLHTGVFKEICKRAEQDPSHRYAIFIDEINRGNVSKIFGELITLIEEGKRGGCSDMIEVILPYSKQTFSVPNNVDIYGTMNTADRSLAYMDTALRRRFSFEEVLPTPSVLRTIAFDDQQVNLKLLLEAINQRLEALIDREHTLGHAYLMKAGESVEKDDLITAFQDKIIPQLTDYFYEDWEKVRLVLADNQIEDSNLQFIRKVVTHTDIFGGDTPEDILQRFELNPDALRNPHAYMKIYSKHLSSGI